MFTPEEYLTFAHTVNREVKESLNHKSIRYNWHEAYVYEGLFNGAFALEWVKIRPCTQKVRGKLIAPEIIDAGKELEDILKKYSIPYEEENGVYCIYGYR